MVPVKVQAYFRAGVSASLNGLPMLSSDAFTLNKLGEHPGQTREAINGVPYTVVTWTSALSAVKAGDYPLNIDLPVMVRVQEKSRQRRGGGHNPFKDFFGDDSPFGDAFSDSFFDDFFAQATEKPLTLHNDGGSVQIDPLPTQGRPASFAGAVGQFEVSSEVTTASATAGDPLSLKMTISGTGNFDRVTTAGLPASSAWKTYKPSAQFEANDASGIARDEDVFAIDHPRPGRCATDPGGRVQLLRSRLETVRHEADGAHRGPGGAGLSRRRRRRSRPRPSRPRTRQPTDSLQTSR